MSLYIKYLCNDKECFESVHEIKRWTERHYDEHSAMHYDCSGWFSYEKVIYVVENCSECGERHELREWEILKKVK